ncbi:hypothetical protein [Winogradskyella sp. 3972H.M.0a.05]|uniref:hypothetical protein n=1 Tax=Winogradskyella sp. 3972H.M.0a.05 TaxID=2950277 RepID=UPI003391EF25
MKKLTLFLLPVLMFACANNEHDLYGKWDVLSKHYSATYKILKENDFIKAKVLYYNDGTTFIKAEDSKPYYVFKNLKASDGLFVDAISGATKADTSNVEISIHIKHKDTLEVTKYIMKKPLEELWIRHK